MMQAIFHGLLILVALVATVAMFVALPIKREKSDQQRRVERNVPAIVLITGLVVFAGLLYGFASDANAEHEISYDELRRKLSSPVDGKYIPPLTVKFSPLNELKTTFTFSSPSSGINCSQVQEIQSGVFKIFGTIYVGGSSISNSIISAGVVRIGPYDVGKLIANKCGRNPTFEDALSRLPH